MNTVILITGYARAGKDTLAEGIALASHHPVIHLNFADTLKQACDAYLQSLDIGGAGASRTFRNEAFKVKHRHFLVEAGTFARSIDRDVFALAFTRQCNLILRNAQNTNLGLNTTIVCSDWRYLNEYSIVSEILGKNGWRVFTVQIDTTGNGAANEEEGKSIGEIVRNIPINLNYSFKPDEKQAIINEGKSLARQIGL
jgi:hypothetical protein